MLRQAIERGLKEAGRRGLMKEINPETHEVTLVADPARSYEDTIAKVPVKAHDPFVNEPTP